MTPPILFFFFRHNPSVLIGVHRPHHRLKFDSFVPKRTIWNQSLCPRSRQVAAQERAYLVWVLLLWTNKWPHWFGSKGPLSDPTMVAFVSFEPEIDISHRLGRNNKTPHTNRFYRSNRSLEEPKPIPIDFIDPIDPWANHTNRFL